MPTLTITDEAISGAKTEALNLDFASGTITARELITMRVEEEVRRYNARSGEVFRGLVQPLGSDISREGFRLPGPRVISPETQVERALEAFGRNGFFILVDDGQIESLDEKIEIGLSTQVSFVKLLPLVGG